MSTEHRGGRLVDKDELARATTRYMVGNLEWSGPVFQASTLFVSAIFDPYARGADRIVFFLVGLHLLLALAYWRGYGPLTRGGWWVAAYPVQALLGNAWLEVMSQPQTYGHSTLCVPGCNYSAPMWLFLAYYPWVPPRLNRWRRALEFLMLAMYFSYFLLLIWLNNNHLKWSYVGSAGVSVMWLFIGYILGVAISKMCLAAAEKQLEVQQQNFTEFFDFLHSHVKAGIAAIRADVADPHRVTEKLRELEEAVSSYRIELLLSLERVPLAALFSERIRTFTGVLQMSSTPRIGQLTVARPVGVLVGRALGDLLKNAAKYGATVVDITCRVVDGRILLEVSDNGPGFSVDILDDESRSLNRLRADARLIGGDLSKREGVDATGSVLSLIVPMYMRKGDGSGRKGWGTENPSDRGL